MSLPEVFLAILHIKQKRIVNKINSVIISTRQVR